MPSQTRSAEKKKNNGAGEVVGVWGSSVAQLEHEMKMPSVGKELSGSGSGVAAE
jgi:hypothetical protein